jgi:hypothetical protein
MEVNHFHFANTSDGVSECFARLLQGGNQSQALFAAVHIYAQFGMDMRVCVYM